MNFDKWLLKEVYFVNHSLNNRQFHQKSWGKRQILSKNYEKKFQILSKDCEEWREVNFIKVLCKMQISSKIWREKNPNFIKNLHKKIQIMSKHCEKKKNWISPKYHERTANFIIRLQRNTNLKFCLTIIKCLQI